MREKKRMLGEDALRQIPKEVTDIGLGKEPKTEGEAFQVAFYHLRWELIF